MSLCLVKHRPIKRYGGEVTRNSRHSQPREWTEMSGQFHTSATLHPESVIQEANLDTMEREILLFLPGIESRFFGNPAPSLVVIPTEIPWPLVRRFPNLFYSCNSENVSDNILTQDLASVQDAQSKQNRRQLSFPGSIDSVIKIDEMKNLINIHTTRPHSHHHTSGRPIVRPRWRYRPC